MHIECSGPCQPQRCVRSRTASEINTRRQVLQSPSEMRVTASSLSPRSKYILQLDGCVREARPESRDVDNPIRRLSWTRVSGRVNEFAKAPCDLVKLYSGLLGTGNADPPSDQEDMRGINSISQAELKMVFQNHASG
jgi:hypothetical protein